MLCVSAADLRSLAQLIPDTARLVMMSGAKDAVQETVSVQTASVRTGDLLQVLSHEMPIWEVPCLLLWQLSPHTGCLAVDQPPDEGQGQRRARPALPRWLLCSASFMCRVQG